MNLPNLPFIKEKNKTEYYLSLVLRSEKASAVIFEEIEGKVNVVGEHEEPFKTSLEDSTDEEFLDTLDKAISTAERALPEGVESHKTILGIKKDWTEAEKIKPEYLLKLKKMRDDLDLNPVGFLVISEAISHLLQKEEGAPISAILVEVGKKNISVSLIKAGKVTETKSSTLAGSISETVETLLKHFSSIEVLPSRIILFDGGQEKLQQEFLNHKWSKDLPFLHVPQVTNLPANFDARAVLNGAASQMSFEVLNASLTKAEKEDKSLPITPLTPETGITEEEKTLGEVASEFGFSDTDIKKKDELVAPPIDPGPAIPPKTAVDESLIHANVVPVDAFAQIPEDIKMNTADKQPLGVQAGLLDTKVKGFISGIKFKSLLSSANGSRKKLLIGIVPLFIVFLIIFIYFFARSTTITLGITDKDASKAENVIFSKSGSTDISGGVISAQFLDVSEDGKISTSATGKKETGDKAKGTVTIFNNSNSGITLPTGTTITSPNNLNFLTDKPITVASASGDTFSGTVPGKGNVTVTASTFGTNYNLPSDTKFTVEGQSNIAAKNDSAFAGGTKKDVKVVAKADQDKLAKDLIKQLEPNAKGDIAKKASNNSEVLPTFISETYSKKSYSADVGSEATDVSLTGVIDYQGVSYQNSDMDNFAKSKLTNDNQKLMVDPASINVTASNFSQKGNNVSAKLTIHAKLVPNLDQKALANQIKGKSAKDAIEILNQIEEVDKIDINTFPPIPLLPNLLPFSSGKIKFIIQKNG